MLELHELAMAKLPAMFPYVSCFLAKSRYIVTHFTAFPNRRPLECEIDDSKRIVIPRYRLSVATTDRPQGWNQLGVGIDKETLHCGGAPFGLSFFVKPRTRGRK